MNFASKMGYMARICNLVLEDQLRTLLSYQKRVNYLLVIKSKLLIILMDNSQINNQSIESRLYLLFRDLSFLEICA